jgi:hypothetical protein
VANPPDDLFVLENLQGFIVYPTKRVAISSVDAASVTTVKENAWNFAALATIIDHIAILGTTVNVGINVVNIYDVRTGLAIGLPGGTFNLDPSPDNPPDPSAATQKPRTLRCGPRGWRIGHGIGVRCMAPQARIQIYYRMELP